MSLFPNPPTLMIELYELSWQEHSITNHGLRLKSYISGIGNWIADEVLYQARIHPLQPSSSLSKENCATLHKCIKEVIETAVEVGADNSQFPCNWIFHSREKKPGKAFVDGKKIDFINAGGRTSAYVPELQKLSGTLAAKAAGKPRKQASKRKGGKIEDTDEDEDVVADVPMSEEEETTKITKPKNGGNTRGRGKKPPVKRKTKEKDDDDDDDSDGKDVSSEENDENPKEKAGKVKANAKTSKQATSSQNGKKPKRGKVGS